jgi:hypothetical protein
LISSQNLPDLPGPSQESLDAPLCRIVLHVLDRFAQQNDGSSQARSRFFRLAPLPLFTFACRSKHTSGIPVHR